MFTRGSEKIFKIICLLEDQWRPLHKVSWKTIRSDRRQQGINPAEMAKAHEPPTFAARLWLIFEVKTVLVLQDVSYTIYTLQLNQWPCISSVSFKCFSLSNPSLIKNRILCLSLQFLLFSISCLIICLKSAANRKGPIEVIEHYINNIFEKRKSLTPRTISRKFEPLESISMLKESEIIQGIKNKIK